MKRFVLILLLLLGAAGAGYAVVHFRYDQATVASPAADGADISWLKSEFRLTDEQFAAIQALHRRFGVVCGEHCADIIAARNRLDEARAAAPPGVIARAEEALADLEAVCNNATREHLHAVAAHMSARQGERFIRMTEPHLSSMPHDGARGLSR